MGHDLHWFPQDVSLSLLSETFAGMANTEGGQVLIGISPGSGKLLGVENTEEIIDKIFQAALLTDPQLVISLPRAEFVQELAILRVEIPAGLPHIYTVSGRYLGREGRHNTPIAPVLLRRKLMDRGGVQREAQAHPKAKLADLDDDLVKAYAGQVEFSNSENLEKLLLRRNCLIEKDGQLLPTHAGLLLFGKEPQRWIPNALILAARFSGTSLSDSFVKQEITGTLPQQLRMAETFVLENIKSVVNISGLTREESPEYPVEAVRELLVNAIAHRDYAVDGDSIHLHIFSNRLEVHSPGLLPGPVTLSNLLEARFSRNPIIVQVLSDIGFIERLGYGLDRVVKVMSKNNLQAPGFQETAGTFRVTISNSRRSKAALTDKHLTLQARYKKLGLNHRQEKAVDFILANARITNRDYQELCPEVHAETLRRDLVGLVKNQVAIKVGSKRGTYYILKDTFNL
jgi:ATP-dependent DNA helicase RecG